MSTPFALLVIAGTLIAAGFYLVLERTLSRIVIGLSLLTNGINVFILAMSGMAGDPPLLGQDSQLSGMVDPLPQAMILTSIVISMATTAFVLALAYRSWRLVGHDEVVDDVEDRRLARRAALARISQRATDEFDENQDLDINYDEVDEDDRSEPSSAKASPSGSDRGNDGGAGKGGDIGGSDRRDEQGGGL